MLLNANVPDIAMTLEFFNLAQRQTKTKNFENLQSILRRKTIEMCENQTSLNAIDERKANKN